MPDPLPLEEALARVLEAVPPPRTGSIPLDRALGLRLAEPVRADRDLPPFDRATVDGYAVDSSDPAVGREPLAVIETVFAGSRPRRRLRGGCAVLVMTGAPLPRGADAVVRREKTHVLGRNEFVVLDGRPKAGTGIHVRGTDLRRGREALAAGTVITPAAVAVLAAVGAAMPRVVLRPRVAVAATGDELRPVEAGRLPAAAIRNSNGPTVEALVAAAGGEPVRLGRAGDDAADLKRVVSAGLRGNDVLVLTGGVSMGDLDLVPGVLAAAGVKCLFHRIRLRPGKPVWFGRRSRTLVFGLPGNPVSVQVTFALLVAPALAALRGDPDPEPVLLDARLEGTLPAEGGREAFLPARARWDGKGELRVRPLPWNGSGDFTGFAGANALLRRAARARAARAGARVELLALGEIPG